MNFTERLNDIKETCKEILYPLSDDDINVEISYEFIDNKRALKVETWTYSYADSIKGYLTTINVLFKYLDQYPLFRNSCFVDDNYKFHFIKDYKKFKFLINNHNYDITGFTFYFDLNSIDDNNRLKYLKTFNENFNENINEIIETCKEILYPLEDDNMNVYVEVFKNTDAFNIKITSPFRKDDDGDKIYLKSYKNIFKTLIKYLHNQDYRLLKYIDNNGFRFKSIIGGYELNLWRGYLTYRDDDVFYSLLGENNITLDTIELYFGEKDGWQSENNIDEIRYLKYYNKNIK